MNKVFKNVLGAMGFSTEDEENFNEEYETPKPRVERTAKASEVSSFSETSGRRNKVVSMSATTQFKVVVIKPANFDDAKEIADRARSGEALARDIYTREGFLLGSVIAKAVNILNPAKVVLGGGVAGAFDLFGPSLKQTVQNEVYTSANPDVEILPTPLGYMAGLYSAAAIAVSRTDPGWSE